LELASNVRKARLAIFWSVKGNFASNLQELAVLFLALSGFHVRKFGVGALALLAIVKAAATVGGCTSVADCVSVVDRVRDVGMLLLAESLALILTLARELLRVLVFTDSFLAPVDALLVVLPVEVKHIQHTSVELSAVAVGSAAEGLLGVVRTVWLESRLAAGPDLVSIVAATSACSAVGFELGSGAQATEAVSELLGFADRFSFTVGLGMVACGHIRFAPYVLHGRATFPVVVIMVSAQIAVGAAAYFVLRLFVHEHRGFVSPHEVSIVATAGACSAARLEFVHGAQASALGCADPFSFAVGLGMKAFRKIRLAPYVLHGRATFPVVVIMVSAQIAVSAAADFVL